MHVIVCGAGQVGLNIARHLATERNEVTVIDQSPELTQKISDTLDVRAIRGHAAHPDVLESAGAREADMIIAVTQVDEVNMVACQVAHSLFNVPVKIARIRSQTYLQPIWADLFSRDHLPIDVIISPEIEVARAVRNRLHVPGAVDTLVMGDGKVRVIGTRVEEDCPIINTPLRQLTSLFPDLHLIVIAIQRDGRTIVPSPDDQMLPGDQVYFVAEDTHVPRSMAAFGHQEPEAHRILIVGGGNIGLYLAQEIERHDPDISIKLVELDMHTAEEAAKALNHTVVVNGDILDQEILDEVNIEHTDSMIAVTNDDEVNVISSLLAKRRGCKRTVALVNAMTYQPLITTLGVDVVVNPRTITVSSILQHLRRGRIRSVHSLPEGVGEVIEAEALETSSVVGKPLKSVKLDKGIIIGAIVRNKEVMIPRGDSVIQAKDRVVLFAAADVIKKAEKLFSVSLEFF